MLMVVQVEREESEIKGRGSQTTAHLESLASHTDTGAAEGSSGPDLVGKEVYDKLLQKLQALGREIKHDPDDDAVVEAARYYASL